MVSLRDGPSVDRSNSSRLRLLIAATAVLALFFVASGGALWHHDAPGSAATCPVCHAAHMPVLMGALGTALIAPAAIEWLAAPEVRLAPASRSVSNASPRAPPL